MSRSCNDRLHADYEVYAKNGENPTGGRPSVDYIVTIDMAKEISMIQRSDKGKEARQYFIACENQLKAAVIPMDSYMIADPVERAKKWIAEQEAAAAVIAEKDETIALLEPRAQLADRLAGHDGLLRVGEAAQVLAYKDYGCDAHNIIKNYAENKERFIEGQHYFKLAGGDLKEFKNRVAFSDLVGKNANQLILWTRRGASRHCKMLGTDAAWEMYDQLEETYFTVQQQKPMSQLEILAGATQALLQHEQQLQALQERAEASEQKVTNIESKLNNLIELQSIDAADDNWRPAIDYVLNSIARQIMGGDYQAARRESYQELRNSMHTDINRIAINKRNRMIAEGGHTKTKIKAECTKIYIIEHSPELRRKYTQVVKTMAARYQIDFNYDDEPEYITVM